MSADYLLRAVDVVLDELMNQAPAVLLTGPRACGKTTTARRRAATSVRLDQPARAAQFRSDPDAALRRLEPPVLLDEWQAAPEVLPAVKRLVDDDPTPGRFLITGSMRFDHGAGLWPGTGRLTRLRMYGVTQAESVGLADPSLILDRLLASAEAMPVVSDPFDLPGYLELAVTGGMPEPMLGSQVGQRWYADYLGQVVDRDLEEQGVAADPDRLRSYLVTLAECVAGLPRQTTLLEAAKINSRTAVRYDGILGDFGLLDLAPAWSSNRLKRLVGTPKIYLTETGLIAAALQVDVDDLLADGDLYGRMLDAFVAAQLRPALAVGTWYRRLHHLRDRDGRHEVDIVVDLGHRGIVAVEVKAAAAVTKRDARHLVWLRDQLGDRFVNGLVLHTGPAAYDLDDRVTAAPISALWTP